MNKICKVCNGEIVHRMWRTVCSYECRSKYEASKQMARNEILRLAGKIRNGNKKLRFEIFKRDGFKCAYCGRGPKDNVVLHVDHIHPKSKGGINSKSNLITACFDCNIGKSDALLSPV